jgi:hypothetical protein
MRKALREGRLLFAAHRFLAEWVERSETHQIFAPKDDGFRYALPILRIFLFLNQIQNKTSPQSWQQLPLFDRAGEVMLDAINNGGVA